MAELIDRNAIEKVVRESRVNNQYIGFRATYHDSECAHFLAMLRNIPTTTEAEIRAKVIEEFVEKLKNQYQTHAIDYCLQNNSYFSYKRSCSLLEDYIDKIAEQLKVGE